MAINIDVVTKLNDRSARTAAEEAQKYFSNAGRTTGEVYGQQFAGGLNRSTPQIERNFKRIETAENKAATATGNVAIAQERYDAAIRAGESDRVKLITHSERLAKARRDEDSAMRAALSAHRDYDLSLADIGNTGRAAVGEVAELGRTIGGLGRVAGVAGVAVVGKVLVDLAGIAATASQSLLLLPAAAGAAAAAFGTLKLATTGFSDALENMRDPEKFAESLNALSPSAQRAALSIQGMLPALDELKLASQDALFNGVGQQLNALATQYLPTIQQMTTGIASAFNNMFSGIANQLLTPSTKASIEAFAGNIASAFQQLAGVAAPLTSAFADLMSVGSEFMPDLARGAADAARAFSQFITEARQSGKLHEWMAEGLDAIKKLGGMVWDVGQAFMALGPDGKSALDTIAQTTHELTTAFVSLESSLERVSGWLDTIRNTVNLLINPLQGVKGFAEQLGLIDKEPTGPSYSAGGSFASPGPAFLPGAPTVGMNLPPGAYRRRDGSVGYAAPPSAQSFIPTPMSGPYGSFTSSAGPSTSGTTGGKLPLGVSVESFGPEAKSAMDASIGQVGAQLDQDLGLSKGLPGLMENLTRFVGNLAFAPMIGALSAIDQMNPNQGSGLMGIMASNGAFGPRFMPSASAAVGPAAWQPGYGGNVGAMLSLAQGANGGKYDWGGSNLAKGLADCSGAVSDLVEVMQQGQATSDRLFTTESFPDYAASHGWLPGMQPGALNVGVKHGGPGGGHMAATLPNGVNFESGGSHGGIAYGGPAAGAGDPQFTEQWYLPTGPAAMGGGVGPSFQGAQRLMNPGGGFGVGPGAVQGAMGGAIGGGAGPTTQYGGFAPHANPGGGGFQGLSGAPMDALMGAASAADLMMPGAGAAAKIGIQLANRAIGYGGQVAGIMTGAIGETLLPKGSELAGNGWVSKIAAGVAGARPALPNTAGAQPQQPPQQQQPGAPGPGQGAKAQGDINVTYNNHQATEDRAGADLTRHLSVMRSEAGGGW